MTATILDGKALAARVRERIAKEIADSGIRPGLAAVLVGDDPASQVYVNMKHRDSASVGMLSRQEHLGADASQEQLLALVDELNADDDIHGILVQLPLPGQLDAHAVAARIDPAKDVDALHPITAGRLAIGAPSFLSCTPYGVLEILADAGVQLAGAHVVVIGRSNLVGRPLATMLTLKGTDATVTIAHSRTRDLAAVTRTADVVVAAAGRPGLVTADMVREGAVVIDVGTNRAGDGSLVGDVDFDAVKEVAGMITPVPGGVGPMTRAMLLQNTLEAARVANGLPRRPCAPTLIAAVLIAAVLIAAVLIAAVLTAAVLIAAAPSPPDRRGVRRDGSPRRRPPLLARGRRSDAARDPDLSVRPHRACVAGQP